MDSAVVDTWKVVSLSPLPWLALVGLAAALLAGVLLAAWGVRREPSRWRRWTLWVLRVAAGLCALAFVLEPGVRQVQVARVRNRVAVLVDRSASMQFPSSSGAGPTRSQQAADLLDSLAPQLDAVKDRFVFETSGFDPELSPVSADTLRKTPPRAGKTDLLAALHALHAGERSAARKLSGVVLLSDGADNTELAQGLSARGKALLDELGVPITTVAVGKSALKDLAIDTVRVDDFAFVRNSLTAEVEVHGRGFAGQAVQLVLRREGQVIATKSVTFSDDDEAQTVRFTFSPDQTGRFVYTASLPVFPDEAVADNNARSFALKVIRDRVRVLLVAGRPSWDERFLRGLLRQDANVDLVSFYILRDSGDEPYREEQLSLIPFPRDEIFRTKIHTFDVIIIMNFGNDDQGVSLTPYQDTLAEYVKGGGAIAVVGGNHAFGDSSAAVDPFSQVLPVEPAGPADLQSFKPRLTHDGERHPITQLGAGGQTAAALWDALPPLPGMNVTRPKPGATVLLESAATTVSGAPAPLVAIQELGRGRTMAIMTDTTWYWAFTSHVGGAPVRTYERFWSNALRWLVRDPDLTSLSVAADAPSIEPGKSVGLTIVARGPDYQPEPGAQVVAELIDAHDGSQAGQVTGVAGPDGTVHLELPPPAPGAYKLVGRATKDGRALGESSDAVAVRAVGPELSDARVNTELLQQLATTTKGAFFDNPSSLSLSKLPLVEPPLVEVGRPKDEPLWDRWSWLVVMVAIVGLEWGLRRRFGYI